MESEKKKESLEKILAKTGYYVTRPFFMPAEIFSTIVYSGIFSFFNYLAKHPEYKLSKELSKDIAEIHKIFKQNSSYFKVFNMIYKASNATTKRIFSIYQES